jgi:hypothetical protein
MDDELSIMKRRSIFQGFPASPQAEIAASGSIGLMPLPPVPKDPPSQLELPPLPVLPLPLALEEEPLADEEVAFGWGPSEEQLACANNIETASQKPVE